MRDLILDSVVQSVAHIQYMRHTDKQQKSQYNTVTADTVDPNNRKSKVVMINKL